MRAINYIVIHCAATRPSQNIGAREIDRMHRDAGFTSIGYHFVIRRNGEIETGRSVEVPGAHVNGFNRDSIGVCLVGGMNESYTKAESNYTDAQWESLEKLIKELASIYLNAEILGHRDFKGVRKDCPCFDAKDWWSKVNG